VTAAVAPSPGAGPRSQPRLRIVAGAVGRPDDARLAGRVERLSAAFTERFGRAPAVLRTAPASVELLGTSRWLAGGPALVAAVDRHAVVAVGPGSAGRALDLLVDVDAPPGAGFATRAAERSALRLALAELHGDYDRLPWTPAELVARSGQPETAVLVRPSGEGVEPVPLDLSAAGLSLVALDTRQRHLRLDAGMASRERALQRAVAAMGVSRPDGHIADRLAACPGLGPVAERSMRHLVTEAERLDEAVAALRSGDPGRLGRLLTRSHTSLSRDLRVSTRQVDATVTAVLEAGAAGARMIGRAFGGAVLALVDPAQQQEVVTAAQAAALRDGFPPPHVLPLALASGFPAVRPFAATGETA